MSNYTFANNQLMDATSASPVKVESIIDLAVKTEMRLNDVACRLSRISEVLTGDGLTEPSKDTKSIDSLENHLNESNWLLNTIEKRLQFIEYKLSIDNAIGNNQAKR